MYIQSLEMMKASLNKKLNNADNTSVNISNISPTNERLDFNYIK